MTLEMDNGPKKVIRAAEDAGADEDPADPLQPVGGIALGAYKVPVTEMAEGYATFAANGRQADWYVLEKVTDDDGGVRFRHQQGWERTFSKAIASNVTASLQTVVDEPAGTGYDNVSDFGRPAAGKTGTATASGGDVSSSWFVGYTPQLATAVMYVRGDGNDDLRGHLNPFYGGEYPARTWETMMAGALQGKPVRGFPEPADLEERIESDISSPAPKPEPSYTPDPVYTPTPEKEPEPTPTPEPEPEPTPTEEPEPTPTEEPEPSPPPEDDPQPTPPDDGDPCPIVDCGGGGGDDDGDQGGGNDAEPGRPPDE
jgi:membrane peptidoglycan carboxypeptidase